MKTTLKRTILVIDQDFTFLSLYNYLLPRSKFNVIKSKSYSEAISFIETIKLDLIICEVDGPNSSGLALMKYMKLRKSKIPLIIVSGSFAPSFPIINEVAFTFVPKIELMQRLPELLKEDSPLWMAFATEC